MAWMELIPEDRSDGRGNSVTVREEAGLRCMMPQRKSLGYCDRYQGALAFSAKFG